MVRWQRAKKQQVSRQQPTRITSILCICFCTSLLDLVMAINSFRVQGTHVTKGRSEVRGGGRKPHKQKGTGRARLGSIRVPQVETHLWTLFRADERRIKLHTCMQSMSGGALLDVLRPTSMCWFWRVDSTRLEAERIFLQPEHSRSRFLLAVEDKCA